MSYKEFINCLSLLLTKPSLCINTSKSKALINNLVRKLPYFSILFSTFFYITILKFFSLVINLSKLTFFLIKIQVLHQFMDCLMMTGKLILNFKIQHLLSPNFKKSNLPLTNLSKIKCQMLIYLTPF